MKDAREPRRTAPDEAPGHVATADEKRPVTERWWWFLGITAWAWPRVIFWPFHGDHSRLDKTALGFMAVGTPVWLWNLRNTDRRRKRANA